MLFMLSNNMESAIESKNETKMSENKTETTENSSDRESSIESFHTNKSEPSNATETELIDVDDIELSDEESWLYKSPKKLTSEEKSASTQKWLQKNVDDMDDKELTATRTALLSKLNQLKLLNSSIEEKQLKKDSKAFGQSCHDLKVEESKTNDSEQLCDTEIVGKQATVVSNGASVLAQQSHTVPESYKIASNITKNKKDSDAEHETFKRSEVFDVVDVQKIARLQEESLKQSTYKFLSQAGKKAMSSRDLSPASPVQIASLNKPASVEALNTCADKANHSEVYSIVPLQSMKKQNIFSSSSALNCNQEFHRSSLPNINKGYYSLKSKKSKRPSDPKVSCPLPIYPSHLKASVNGAVTQGSVDSYVKSAVPSFDHRETSTLPSSYRVHSRSNSASRRDTGVLSPSPRRESVPFLGSNSSIESCQRENYRKYSSPVPSAHVYPRYYTSSSATVSPTKALNSQPPNLRSPPGLEYHRATSHSPSGRLPLSTVQHQSPKKGNLFMSPRNGEIRTLKASSKIPSPASRSGIPVPSTTPMSRANEDDDWSQDCY